MTSQGTTTDVQLLLSLPAPPLKKTSSVRITLPPSAVPSELKQANPGLMTFTSSVGELRSCDSHTMSHRVLNNGPYDDSGTPDAKPVAVVTTQAPSSILLSPRMDEGDGGEGMDEGHGSFVPSATQPMHVAVGQATYSDENAKPIAGYLETIDSGGSTEPSTVLSGEEAVRVRESMARLGPIDARRRYFLRTIP